MSYVVFFFKQKTAYEMRISDWSSDVCSSDLIYNEVGRTEVIEDIFGDDAAERMHNCKSGARDGFKCKLAVHNGNVFEIRAHRRIDNGTTCNTLPCPRWCILGLKQFQFLADLPLKIVDSANVNVMERLVGDFQIGRASCRESVGQSG